MKYLFLDNFRGFNDTIIPLLDVNFLVGENSSGKTSLLTMLRMFSGPQLFMGQDYESVEAVQLGHFQEMVSAHSDDQSYFRVGHIGETTRNKESLGNGILLTYENIEGLSQITRVTTTLRNSNISLRIEGKKGRKPFTR